jgi:virginiamycin B lyase
MRSLIVLTTVVAAAQLATTSLQAQAKAPTPEAKEFTADWLPGTRPRDPHADQKGRVWFVGQAGNYIGRLDPSSGDIKRFEIDPGTNPHNLVVDAKGTVWFTGNRNNRIVKMDPETGKLTTYMIPDPTVRDPHTMIIDNKAGIAWFTAQQSTTVGRLDIATGEFKLWKYPPRTNPYGIVLDSKGRPWFDLFGTNKIGTIDPKTLEQKEYVLPSDSARPRRIAITSDDAVWYGDFRRGFLGRLDPATGKVEDYKMPGGLASFPYGMAVDDRDRIWVAETGSMPIKLVSFDAKKRVFEDQIILGGGSTPNSVRHMTFDPASRMIWFGQDRGIIGGVRVPTVVVP